MEQKSYPKYRLPLDAIMIVGSELFPRIQELQSSLSGPTANTAIVDLLRSASLEHHLPKPPPLNPRRFAVRLSMFPVPHSILTIVLVVGCVYCLAHFANLGRDLYPRNDASRNLELYGCTAVLCEAHTGATTPDYGNGVQCRRWATRAYGIVSITETTTLT